MVSGHGGARGLGQQSSEARQQHLQHRGAVTHIYCISTSIYLYIYLGAVTQLQVQVSRTQLRLPKVGAADSPRY